MRIKDLGNTATEADLTSGNYFALDGSAGSKKMPCNCVAPKSVQNNLSSSIAPEFDDSKVGGYVFGEIFNNAGKRYITIDDFTGAFDNTKVMLVSEIVAYFFESFISYFRKNGLGQNGRLRTRQYDTCTFYMVPVPAGTHVSLKKSYSSMASPAADFVRYNSDKTVKSYTNAKTIDYTTTEDEYLSFAFQPKDVYSIFVLPVSPANDVIGKIDSLETSAVTEYMLDEFWRVTNGYLDADGNIVYGSGDYGYICSYKVPMPAGAQVTITKSDVLSSQFKDFAAYDTDGSLLATLNGGTFSYTFTSDGFISFVILPSGIFTIKANKVLETFAMNYKKRNVSLASLSIISSSSSTYSGFIPAGQISYYGPNVGQVDLPNGVLDTWWHKVCTQLKIPLLLNDSASGSYYTTAGGIGTPQITRLEKVYGPGTIGDVRPDILIFYTCINDSYRDVAVGSPKYSGWTDVDKAQIAPALCYGFDLIKRYAPGVKILNITNFTLKTTIKEAMAEICEHYGVPNIVLPTVERSDAHPTARGMTQISEFVKRFIREFFAV